MRQKKIELNHSGGINIWEDSITDLVNIYDFIAANIISGVLVALALQLASHLKPDSIAVLSGFSWVG